MGLLLLLPALLSAQSVDDLLTRGRAQLDSGKAEAAINTFEQAVKRDARNPAAHLWLAQAIGAAAPKANVLRQPFMARRARQSLETVIALDPQSLDGRYGLVQFYLQAPGVLGGSVDKARDQANEMMRILPARGHIALAQVARKLKDTTTYERELRNAIRVAPDSLAGYSQLAFHLAATKRSAEAQTTLEQFLARNPNHAQGLRAQERLKELVAKQ
jgi:tetratricopeptide (TPR) repeat protein